MQNEKVNGDSTPGARTVAEQLAAGCVHTEVWVGWVMAG